MGRYKTMKYDYPKEGSSLSEISKKVLGKSYQETTDSEARKIKRIFREVNK